VAQLAKKIRLHLHEKHQNSLLHNHEILGLKAATWKLRCRRKNNEETRAQSRYDETTKLDSVCDLDRFINHDRWLLAPVIIIGSSFFVSSGTSPPSSGTSPPSSTDSSTKIHQYYEIMGKEKEQERQEG